MPRARIVSVVGGSGGLGASVLTAAVTVNAAGCVLALDGRPFGGGLDIVLGLDEHPGLRWPDLAEAAGVVEGERLLHALPAGVMRVLAFDRRRPFLPEQRTVPRVVAALAEHVDLVVVDAPRPGEEGFATVVELSDDIVYLAGGGICEMASAIAGTSLLADCSAAVWLVVRKRRGYGDLPQALATTLDLPLLGSVPEDRKVDDLLDSGGVPGGSGALRRTARELLDGLDLAWRP